MTPNDTSASTGAVAGLVVTDELVADAQAIIARYPQSRSALLPMLHLVQSAEGYVSAAGIEQMMPRRKSGVCVSSAIRN